MTLALDYRPTRFDQLVGQRGVRMVLQQIVRTGDVPAAMLFTGTRGSGKTTSGRILAAALNAGDGDGDVDLTSDVAAEILEARSSDVIEIDAASNGKVEDVRKLQQMVQYASAADWRVVLLDEAHSMSNAAFNALLKVLEEPPPKTVFILLTTEPTKILDTITSRCMRFDFTRISINDIVARLGQVTADENWIKASKGAPLSPEPDKALFRYLAGTADGSMRNALMSLDMCLRVGASTVDQYRTLTGAMHFGPKLLLSLVSPDPTERFRILDEVWDVCSDVSAVVREFTEALTLAFRVSSTPEGVVGLEGVDMSPLLDKGTERLMSASRTLWSSHGNLLNRFDVELCLALMSDDLRSSDQPEVTPVRVNEPMSLEAMRSAK